MFARKQMTMRDLFSSNKRASKRTGVSDPIIESTHNSVNSQYQYSQIDYSESQVQDVESQLSNTSSDSSAKKYFVMYKKPPLYGKDLKQKQATPPGRDSQPHASNKFGQELHELPPKATPNLKPPIAAGSGGSTMKLSYQQQLMQNKSKAKERDERDLLYSMLNCMKECAADVKSAVGAVKENVQQGISTSQSDLTDHLEKLQKDLNSHKEEMVQALHIRDEMKEKISTLMQSVAAKEAKIAQLESQVQEYREEQNRRIIQELQKSFFDGIEETKDQVTQAYEGHQKELQKISYGQDKLKKDVIQNAQMLQKDTLEQNIDTLRQLHSRVNEDIQNNRDEEKNDREEFGTELKGSIEKIQRLQREDIKALLRQQLLEVDKINDEKQMEAFQEQYKQLKELQEQHKLKIKEQINDQLCDISHEQETFVKSMIDELWQKENRTAKIIQKEQQRNIQEEIQKRCDKEVIEMRKKHKQEVQEILAQQQQETEKQHKLQQESLQREQDMMNKFNEALFPKNSDFFQDYQSVPIGELFDLRPTRYSSENNNNDINADDMQNAKRLSNNLRNTQRIHESSYNSDGKWKNKSSSKGFLWNKPTKLIEGDENENSGDGCSFQEEISKKVDQQLFKAPIAKKIFGGFGQKGNSDRPKGIFVSPLLANRKWTSKELFCKSTPSPSPIATVLPQVQTILVKPSTNNNNIKIVENISKPQTRSRHKAEEENAPTPVEQQVVQKKKAPKRKKKSVYPSKKRRNNSKKNVQIEVQESVESNEIQEDTDEEAEIESQLISNRFQQLPDKKTVSFNQTYKGPQKSYQRPQQQQLSVFEFTDESDKCLRITETNNKKESAVDTRWLAACKIKPNICSNKQKTVPSPPLISSPDIMQSEIACSSLASSPSFSLSDVILKGSKTEEEEEEEEVPCGQNIKDEDLYLQNEDSMDFLSTPFFNKAPSQSFGTPYEIIETTSGKNKREAAPKRKLVENLPVRMNCFETGRRTRRN